MTDQRRPSPTEDGWERLHPLSPLLRGGLALLVIFGIVVANLRDRIIEIFFHQAIVEGIEESGGESGDVIDLIEYLVAQRLIIFVLLGVLGLVLLIVFFAWLSWRFNTFRITREGVEEKSGVVFRQHRRAPLERIQSVNLQRPLLARALGLTAVDVQTAGEGGKVALRYLSQRAAKDVRARILRAADSATDDSGSRAPASSTPGEPGAAVYAPGAHAPSDQVGAALHGHGPVPDPAGQPRPEVSKVAVALDRRARDFADQDVELEAHLSGSLVRVPVGRLIASIVLSWELTFPVAITIAAIVSSIVWEPAVLAGVLPIAIVFIALAFGQFNRGWGFTLSRSGDSIRVGAGLTSTITETLPLSRVHAVEARQPLLWRPFGWWKIRITTAGYSLAQGGQNKMQNIVLPVGLVADAVRVIETILPDAVMGEQGRRELVDALTGPGAGYLRAGRRSGWVLWFGTGRAGLKIDSGVGDTEGVAEQVPWRPTLRVRRGVITRSLGIMPIVRAQSLQLRRPLLHRALGLASVQAHTVLGPIRMEMRGIDLARAKQAFDELAATVVRVQAADAERLVAQPDPVRQPDSASQPDVSNRHAAHDQTEPTESLSESPPHLSEPDGPAPQ